MFRIDRKQVLSFSATNIRNGDKLAVSKDRFLLKLSYASHQRLRSSRLKSDSKTSPVGLRDRAQRAFVRLPLSDTAGFLAVLARGVTGLAAEQRGEVSGV